MTNCTVALDSRAILVLVGLFVFGFFYNWIVARLEATGHDRGYTAFLVVGGCLVTIIGASTVAGWEVGLWLLACFAASGIWMVIGSWARHTRAEQAERKQVAELAKEMLDAEDEKESGRVCDEAGADPSRERK